MSAVEEARRTKNSRLVASTATGAAMMKAMEAHEPPDRRLFDDALVARLLPAPARVLVAIAPLRKWALRAIERKYRGLFGGFVCRTRAIDDVTRRAVCEGISSVVILGSGFDTRPYRMPELAGVAVFEVDLPEVVEKKRAALARAGVSSESVRFVALDFEVDDLSERLAECGWDRASRTLFLWEGVTQYVARDAVYATLRLIAGAVPGSEVCFSYVPSDVIEGRSKRVGVEAAGRFLARGTWVTGFEPSALASELATLGLHLVEDVGAADYQARYLAPRGRDMEVFEIERVAVARVP
jgi:methyltransferase (TIGR00027 family)